MPSRDSSHLCCGDSCGVDSRMIAPFLDFILEAPNYLDVVMRGALDSVDVVI